MQTNPLERGSPKAHRDWSSKSDNWGTNDTCTGPEASNNDKMDGAGTVEPKTTQVYMQRFKAIRGRLHKHVTASDLGDFPDPQRNVAITHGITGALQIAQLGKAAKKVRENSVNHLQAWTTDKYNKLIYCPDIQQQTTDTLKAKEIQVPNRIR
jgi:hypothetical protein